MDNDASVTTTNCDVAPLSPPPTPPPSQYSEAMNANKTTKPLSLTNFPVLASFVNDRRLTEAIMLLISFSSKNKVEIKIALEQVYFFEQPIDIKGYEPCYLCQEKSKKNKKNNSAQINYSDLECNICKKKTCDKCLAAKTKACKKCHNFSNLERQAKSLLKLHADPEEDNAAPIYVDTNKDQAPELLVNGLSDINARTTTQTRCEKLLIYFGLGKRFYEHLEQQGYSNLNSIDALEDIKLGDIDFGTNSEAMNIESDSIDNLENNDTNVKLSNDKIRTCLRVYVAFLLFGGEQAEERIKRAAFLPTLGTFSNKENFKFFYDKLSKLISE